jgi:AraC-like DNA-binding protein
MALVDGDAFRRLCRARDFLASGFAERISLEEAAREACLSPFHFQRLFARTFGESPREFTVRLRMEEAKRLLLAGELPVTEVCLEVGYSSLGTFSARFTERMGQPPTEFRRTARRWIAPRGGWRLLFVPCCYSTFWMGSQDRRSAGGCGSPILSS